MDVVSACLAWSVFTTYRLRTFEVEMFISALFHSNGVFFFFFNIQMRGKKTYFRLRQF